MKPSLQKQSKKHPALYKELAHSYLESNDLKKAAKALNRYFKKYPDELTGLIIKGLLEEQMSMFEQAEETYRRIIDFEPGHIRALNRLIWLEEMKENPSDYWKKCLFKFDPLSPKVKDILESRKSAESTPEAQVEEEEIKTPAKPPPQEAVSEPEAVDDAARGIQPELEEQTAGPDEKPAPPKALKSEEDAELLSALAKQFDLDEDETEELEIIFKEEEKKRPDESGVIKEDIAASDEIVTEPAPLVEEPPQEIQPPPETEESTAEPVVEPSEKPPASALPAKEKEVIDREAQKPEILEHDESLEDAVAEPEAAEPTSTKERKEISGEAEEIEEIPPPAPESEEEKAPPSTSEAEIDELKRIYREVSEHSGDKKSVSREYLQEDINTTTMAEIYAVQNDYEKALRIYRAFPEEEQAKQAERIKELELKLQEQSQKNQP